MRSPAAGQPLPSTCSLGPDVLGWSPPVRQSAVGAVTPSGVGVHACHRTPRGQALRPGDPGLGRHKLQVTRVLNVSSWLSRLRGSASPPTFLGPDFLVWAGGPGEMTPVCTLPPLTGPSPSQWAGIWGDGHSPPHTPRTDRLSPRIHSSGRTWPQEPEVTLLTEEVKAVFTATAMPVPRSLRRALVQHRWQRHRRRLAAATVHVRGGPLHMQSTNSEIPLLGGRRPEMGLGAAGLQMGWWAQDGGVGDLRRGWGGLRPGGGPVGHTPQALGTGSASVGQYQTAESPAATFRSQMPLLVADEA